MTLSSCCLRYCTALVLLSYLAGCEQAENGKADSADASHYPYTSWVTKQQITGDALSEELLADEGFAHRMCEQDSNKPEGYDRHIAVISTATTDKIDLTKVYQLDIEKPITLKGSETVLIKRLGDLLAEEGGIEIAYDPRMDIPKLSFSENGRFTGYCSEDQNYSTSLNLDRNGQFASFRLHCSTPAILSCLSVKD